MFIARIVFLYKVLCPQMCLFNMCFFIVIFFYYPSFVFKFLTSKVVEGVYSYFKSSRVCSLPKTALFWKSIWFIANSNWWFLKLPTKQKFIKFCFIYLQTQLLPGGFNNVTWLMASNTIHSTCSAFCPLKKHNNRFD
jgi:hypothetical protein